MSKPAGRSAVLLLAVLVAACGADEQSGTGLANDAGAGGGGGGRADRRLEPITTVGLGEECTSDVECSTRLCLRFDEEDVVGFCSEFCIEDDDCSISNWLCVLVLFDEGDLGQVCMPEDMCVDMDEDLYGIGPGCDGADCDDDDDRINPNALEACDGIDNDCNGNVDEAPIDANVGCLTNDDGVCQAGTSLCIEGEIVCFGLAGPSDEICDGLDNDCDGLVDEGPDGDLLVVPCYGGPDDTEGHGLCTGGFRVCKSGSFGECEEEVLPSLETCDGLDNDCNDVIDDAVPEAGRVCETDLPGLCARGITECNDDGEVVCVPSEGAEEICDGIDNDCDDEIDEDEEGEPLARACYNGEEGTLGRGLCRAGVQYCDEGDFGPCEDEVLPTPEICDRLNNDCDLETDEGVLGGGFPCDTELDGVCAAGISRCDDGGSFCDQLIGETSEICDGLDNDCDGDVDETEAGGTLTTACYDGPAETEGEGACSGGLRTCSDGQFGVCEGQVLPTAEVCDTVDNNCNEANNEDNPGGGVPCDTGLDGVCAAGITECRGVTLVCEPVNEASDEVCDGRDNDCDGDDDEDELGGALVRDCYSGPEGTLGTGICVAGTQTCTVDGEYGPCTGERVPDSELCDDVDNNCNDVNNEGNPEGGYRCRTGLSGACAVGTTRCLGEAIECVPDVDPQDEVCDGLDNDCNGVIDNGFVDLGQVCFSGDGICRRVGVWICNAADDEAPPVCDAIEGDPDDTDVCNYLDDNCDGFIDEPFRNDDGVYYQTENCGACGINCGNLWAGGAEAVNAVPACEVEGAAAICGFECLDGYEDADRLDENGCEFLPDPTAIYVATGGVNVDTCGDWDEPCKTITYGTGRAVDTGRTRVNVSDGVYFENVFLEDGISVFGGYNSRSWVRDPDVNVTVIRGTSAGMTGPDRMTVNAIDIVSSTEVSGFTITASNGADSGNSIGVYVLDSDDSLVIRDNFVFAGRAGDGRRGDNGAPGPQGADAGAGGPSGRHDSACSGSFDVPGGAGGVLECPNVGGGTTGVSGGDGGDSTCPEGAASVNGAGADGSGDNFGTGGRGGGNMGGGKRYGANVCFVYEPTDPKPGLRGQQGADNTGGPGAVDPAGTVDIGGADQWRGEAGQVGLSGTHGSGGGGGGAGPGVDRTQGGTEEFYGASGGGGGSGGCAGLGAEGGEAGGASFSVMIAFTSAPTSANDMPRVEDNRLARGRAGDGGEGGIGGAGGDLGRGGAGGVADTDDGDYAFCLEDGAVGADGGRGGHAGGGGGGSGGISFDIYVWNTDGFDPGYAAGNFQEIGGAVDTAGFAGQGGTSNNTIDGQGGVGVDGEFGYVRMVP
jgi:hypothetical protein